MQLSAFVIAIVSLLGSLNLSTLSENVETRIHKLIKPGGLSRYGFGASLEVDQKTELIIAGAPKLTKGGFFKCDFTFNSLTNQSSTCVSSVHYGNENSSVGSIMTKIRVNNKDYIVVCGNRYWFSCPGLEIERRMIGECHSHSLDGNNGNLKNLIPNPCPFKCPQGIFGDLIFVLDASGSVNKIEFRTGLNWVVTVLKQFSYDIDAKNLKVGYVVYSTKVQRSVQPRPRTFYELKDEILAITRTGRGTYTHLAIDEAKQLLNPTSESVTKIMITVTDGRSVNTYYTRTAAKNARNAGIVMIAVGVGINTKNEDWRRELEDIANGNPGDSTRVMTVTDYANLNSIVGELSQVIKESASGTLEGTSSNSSTELTNCQFGTSITPTLSGFSVGAVGSYDRVGTVSEYRDMSSFPESAPSRHLSDKDIAAMLGTTTVDLKDAYFGYSVTSGNFTRNNVETALSWIATGAPRYLSRGLVLIYRNENSQNQSVALRPSDVSGHWQLGGYYGHSVLAIDINKDNYKDLIVSAPLYSALDKYDSGIVFVYMNDKSPVAVSNWTSPSFSPLILEGSRLSGSRFGMTIVDGGDIDNNGYSDIIIGAPYEKDSTLDRGSGAIYIYYANSRGLDPTAKQRILGSSVSSGSQALNAFGYAIRGGVDIDYNGYSDVIVAAPSSDTVVLLRTRKIIDLDLKLSISPTTINVINCTKNLPNNCSEITICYSAKFKDNKFASKTFDISLNVTLDSLVKENGHQRLLFTNSKTNKITENNIQAGSSSICKKYHMQLNLHSLEKANGAGFDTVPRVEMRIDTTESHKGRIMSAVLSPLSQNSKSADWTFNKGCNGTNDRCEHDLVLKATYSKKATSTPLLLDGSGEVFRVSCVIENKGPDHAYFLRVIISSGNLAVLRFLGECAVIVEDESDPTNGVTIIKYKTQNAETNFKDRILPGETCEFVIEFDFTKLEKSANETQFKIQGKILSNAGGENVTFDSNKTNNEIAYKQDIQYKSDFKITQLSVPKNVPFHPHRNTDNATIQTLEDDILGGGKINFEHKYTIYNKGPLGLANARAKISWPEKTENGYTLLYLVDVLCQPEKACKCSKTGKTNKMQILKDNSSVPSNFMEIFVQYPNGKEALSAPDKIMCSNSRCDEIYCDLDYIGPFNEVTISAHFIPWVPTFSKTFTKLDIYSSFDLIIANSTPASLSTNEMVGTTMTSLDVVKTKPGQEIASNIGPIIGSVVGGIVLLIIAIVVMWKLGFFKSKYGDMTRAARESVQESDPDSAPGIYENMTSDQQMNKSTEQLKDDS